MSRPEPRNPFYLLLLLVSFLFVITALAYAIVPTLEQKAMEAGQPSPPSPWRDSLRSHGWVWLLWELAGMVVFALFSMGLDRLRSLKMERAARTIPPAPDSSSVGRISEKDPCPTSPSARNPCDG
jgi:hypothetical protein